MVFASGKEMYEFVADGNDLYNPQNGLYVFVYNDAGALCYYTLSESMAKDIAREAKEADEYWGAFLGPGGHILDDGEYDKFRYSKSETKRNLYLKPSLDFCEEYFTCHGWLETEEFLKGEEK